MSYPDFMDYGVAVARGHEENEKTIKANLKHGRITVLSTGNQTIWDRNTLYVYPSVASLMKVASSSANDATNGSGVVSIFIEGVLAAWTGASETMLLEGNTAKTTTTLFFRVNRITCGSTGAGNENAGNIALIADAEPASTFTAGGVPTTTSRVYAQVLAGTGKTQMARYSVPLTFTAYITEIHLSSGRSKVITSELVARQPGKSFKIESTTDFTQFSTDKMFNPPLKIPAKTDIELRARGSSTAGIVSGEFNMILAEGD